MKITSQQIGRGKLGNAIYASVGGECIARQYQPNVTNPSTPAQVQQRAKMKLITQIAASLSPVIAMQKSGLVSAQNKFVKKNFGLTSYAGETASIQLSGIQLTEGSTLIPAIQVTNLRASGMTCRLTSSADATISRVVYLVYKTGAGNQLELVDSKICETAGQNRDFSQAFDYVDADGIVYAYAMRDSNEAATAKYANYSVQTATRLAQLIATRTLNANDYKLTGTVASSYAMDDGD